MSVSEQEFGKVRKSYGGEKMSAAIKENEKLSEVEELYNKHKDRLYRIAYSRLHSPQDAEDAVAECFYRIVNKSADIFAVSPNKRTAYLNILIRNVCAQMFNNSIKIQSVSLDDEENFQNDVPDCYNLEDEVLGNISKEKLVGFIKQMSEKLRDALVLTVVMGYSYCESAEKLGITENTLRQRIFEARKQIKAFAQKEEIL